MRSPRRQRVYRTALIDHLGRLLISASRFVLIGLPAVWVLRRLTGRSVIVGGGAVLMILGAGALLIAGVRLRAIAARRVSQNNKT